MKMSRRSFVGTAAAAAAASIGSQGAVRAQTPTPTLRLRPGGNDHGFDPWLEIIGDHFRHNAREVSRLAGGRPITAYNGFDPTSESLHVGNLVPVFGLLHLQRHGNLPVVVVGGGTGMIGDPSGKSAERAM